MAHSKTLAILCCFALGLAGCSAGVSPNGKILADRQARKEARLAVGHSSHSGATYAAYMRIKAGAARHNPAMQYAMAELYLKEWQALPASTRGAPGDPLLPLIMTASQHRALRAERIANAEEKAHRLYYSYVRYLKLAAHGGDPTAQAALAKEYAMEPTRMIMLASYMIQKNGGENESQRAVTATAMRGFLKPHPGSRAFRNAYRKALYWERLAVKNQSPKGIFFPVMLRMLQLPDMIHGAAGHPRTRRALRNLMVWSKEHAPGALKKAALGGNVDAAFLRMCQAVTKGGNSGKWASILKAEAAQGRYGALSEENLIRRYGLRRVCG